MCPTVNLVCICIFSFPFNSPVQRRRWHACRWGRCQQGIRRLEGECGMVVGKSTCCYRSHNCLCSWRFLRALWCSTLKFSLLILKTCVFLWTVFVGQLNPYTVVGFFARAYTQPLIGWSKYHYKMGKKYGARYSIILPNVAFIHKEYFRIYTEKLPSGMADLIDKFNNCEDLSMSFVVSDLCQCASGLHMEPRVDIIHLSGKAGLSGSSNHPSERGICISVFATFFEGMPLKEINCVYS